MKNKKIIKNTVALYARQILILLVNLYSMHVLLAVLGIESYGVYSVVTGIVALGAFLPGSMAAATQRFFSYAIGEQSGNKEKLYKTFSVNLVIYICIAILALILMESVGLWFVKMYLKVPFQFSAIAITLYHLSIFTFMISVLTSPFIAIMIAHEDMHIYASVSILEAVLKLCIVFFLMIIPYDKMELYGLLVLVAALINMITYVLICIKKYDECQFNTLYLDKKLLKEIINFTGWTLFGQLSTIARTQAVTILLNQQFNPGVVAARAISITISNQVNLFSNNFNTGIYPAIIKSYAEKNMKEMYSLIFNGSKLTFFLMWLFALPILAKMDYILDLWLNKVPYNVVLFSKLGLLEAVIVSITLPIMTAARAPGKMKLYELTLGVMQISIFIITWIILYLGYPAYSVFIVGIIFNVLMFIVRLAIVHKLIGLPIVEYIRNVLMPVIAVVIITVLPVSLMVNIFPNKITYNLFIITTSMLLTCIAMYFIGLNGKTRIIIKNKIFNKIKTKEVKA